MYAEERQQAISSLVNQRTRVSVTDLADHFGVTTETVRRDLAVLERIGVVRRVHGGAVPASALTAIEPATTEREFAHADQKDRIAKSALEFLPGPGGSVLFDAGTSTGRIAALLPTDRELTVVTNSVPIAARVSGLNSVHLHMLGGRVRGLTQAAVGPEALRVLSTLRVDVAFIGTNALSVGHGLSTPDSDEAEVKRAMLDAAQQIVVVADSSKIGREHMISFGSADRVDVLVTDSGISDAARGELRNCGMEVVVA
ncbi:DeoR/GlpR family DNA-binding transcription regulator [Antrihabitans sp. YC2-6]|uniref:DeoR/GlpR family DNA-binding transcription regulator n=1 Tax=Antrihabitans sp. YC2-6 TaxID=2799498 RepID=UPI0018F4E154|nr:DeoR/GlpR family DNA-binding transcription regulator [Antrihabitans sp. YC2-6]MBJ8345029.1 DeoR/GlpR transcriptional regulator [Antrihabitans sp. YC2-6]